MNQSTRYSPEVRERAVRLYWQDIKLEKKMDNREVTSRRMFIKRAGSFAAVLPLVSIGACSDGNSGGQNSASSSDKAPATPPKPVAVQTPAPTAVPASAPAGLVKLSEDDPTAQALGYKHSTAQIDPSAFPLHQADQTCVKCIHYRTGSSSGWGGCAIFPGKEVAAEGWCNVYAAKS